MPNLLLFRWMGMFPIDVLLPIAAIPCHRFAMTDHQVNDNQRKQQELVHKKYFVI